LTKLCRLKLEGPVIVPHRVCADGFTYCLSCTVVHRYQYRMLASIAVKELKNTKLDVFSRTLLRFVRLIWSCKQHVMLALRCA